MWHIWDTINSINDRPAILSKLLPNWEDQIPQLIQSTLNFSKQIIYHAITKVLNVYISRKLNKKLGADTCCLALVNKHLIEPYYRRLKIVSENTLGPDF